MFLLRINAIFMFKIAINNFFAYTYLYEVMLMAHHQCLDWFPVNLAVCHQVRPPGKLKAEW